MPGDARPPATVAVGGGTDARKATDVAVAEPESAVVPPDVARSPGSVAPLQAVPSQWLGAICPYLRAEDGTWRSAVPAREHRCWAVEPASPLPVATQQQLCLSTAHGGCERFLHARDQRAAALAVDHIALGRLEAARFGPFVSPVPIAVDARPPGGDLAGRTRVGRRRIPALLIGGGVILVGIVALAAILGGGRSPSVAVVSPSPAPSLAGGGVVPVSPAATLLPSTRPDPSAAPTVQPSTRVTVAPTADGATIVESTSRPTPSIDVDPTPRPSATPRPTPTPEIARRYTVKQGDTVKSIALKFGLRPRDLRAVNDIGKDVVVGQRLRIPARSVSPP